MPWYDNVMVAQTSKQDKEELHCAQLRALMRVGEHSVALVRWYEKLAGRAKDSFVKEGGCTQLKWKELRGGKGKPFYQLVPLSDLKRRVFVAPDFIGISQVRHYAHCVMHAAPVLQWCQCMMPGCHAVAGQGALLHQRLQV